MMSNKRSWDAFGTAIVGLGISVIFNVVLVYIANKYTSILSMIVAVIVGMVGVFIIFLGIRISGWDKGPKMSRIDSGLDYQLLLTFRGKEEEVRDFSRMEEVLTAFDLGKEAWSLRIVPPIGALSEWKGYYEDKRETYMTEITFVRKDKIQKWGLRCDYSYLEILNRELKKVIVDKKKASLWYFVRIDNSLGEK